MPAVAGYDVVAKLGQGGMADVFLAVARGPIADVHKLVVLKRLRESLQDEEDFARMFEMEAKIASRFNHPNVVHTYSVAAEGDRPLIVMEYLEGVSLSALAKRLLGQPWPQRVVLLRAVSEALAGLHYVHEFRDYDGTSLGLVHRDLKPGNVLVTFDGQVKVLDFGVAKRTAVDSTASVAIKGTTRYMSPEAVGHAPSVDRRADLFSCGVMLWELASGKKLWDGISDLQVLRRLSDNQVPTIASVDSDVPAELSAICERALQTDPDHRYPTAAALKKDLDAFLATQAAPSSLQDLADCVVEHYGPMREERARAVQARLQRVADAPPSASVSSVPSFSPPSATSAHRPTVHTGPARSGTRAPIVVGVGVVALLGVAYALGRSGSTAPEPAEAPASAPLDVAPAAAPVVVPADAPVVAPVGTKAAVVAPPSVISAPPPAPSEDEVDVEVLDDGEPPPVPAGGKKRRGPAPRPGDKPKPSSEPAAKPLQPGELPDKPAEKKKPLDVDRDSPWDK